MRYHRAHRVGDHVVIVGGGIAGLAASIYLARGGKTVTIFEKRRQLGGRAVTHIRHGFRFNLGPHAVYQGGAATQVFRELCVPVRGGTPVRGGAALLDGERHRLPASLWSILTTSLIGAGAKLETARLLLRIKRIDPKPYAAMTVRQWLDREVRDASLRRLMEAYVRLATYSNAPDELSAAAALRQLKLVLRGVLYVDEGWQKLVDGLHSHAVAAGVNFVNSSRVVRVDCDDRVRGVELGGLEIEDRNDTLSIAVPEIPPEGVHGTRLPADTVLLAVDPAAARELAGDAVAGNGFTPVTATCLDVALSRLPEPDATFALGIDQPLYFSVHSAWAQLTPLGGALIHTAKYRRTPLPAVDDELDPTDRRRRAGDSAADEAELESLLDLMQPGWRDVLVHRRFLPSMTVMNALPRPAAARPSPATSIRGLYLAGDWVGEGGMLSDAALSSARAAAREILADA